jgi:hypothetical protein
LTVPVPIPVPKPEGLSLFDFTEFLYTAFIASRFGPFFEPLAFEDSSPGVRGAWKCAALEALKLAPQVRVADLPVGPNAMYASDVRATAK